MFNPQRLEVARRRRGFTQTKLAAAAGLQPRTIKSYERGERDPSAETLQALAAALEFPATFFEGDDLETIEPEGVSYRSMSRMTAAQRDAALGAAALALTLNAWIDKRFNLPPASLPELRQGSPADTARSVRAAWGLGILPIRSMVHLLEQHGVRVFSLVEKGAEVDAFSFWRGLLPFVFLNTAKSAERSRFDAAHELGHLVMHRHGGTRPGEQEGRQLERDADEFASEFLMPREALNGAIGRMPSIAELVQLKLRFGVSLAAITYRLHALGMITEWHYRSLCIAISEQGYRKKEPATIPRETSQVLERVFAMLRDEGTSKSAIARELTISARELERLVFGLVLLSLPGGEGTTTGRGPAPNQKPRLRLA